MIKTTKRIIKALTYIAVMYIRYFYFKFFAHRVECNICGWRDNKFDSDLWHPNTICPKCKSQIRHRLFWAAILEDATINLKETLELKDILHFAPDTVLMNKIKELTRSYTTADFLKEGYAYEQIDLHIDISDLNSIESDSYDCVIAFDVLEHVPNHLTAMKEVNRILRTGGYCIFTVPQKDGLQSTFEDDTIIDPKKREEVFGQWDHLRIYGNDFGMMLEDRGFKVKIIDKNNFSSEVVAKNVLFPPVISSHPLATNQRKIYFGKKVI